ncbi:MAG: polysaccharide biosynthesis tyrosine autokinase [Celeribacter sp.]
MRDTSKLTPPPAPQADDGDEIDLMELAGSLWRGKWLILATTFLALIIGGWYAYGVAVPKYTATTSLALQLRKEAVVDLESVVSGVSTETSSINTELEVIRSRGLLEKLVTRLDLTRDPEFNSALRPPSAVARLKAMLLGGDGPASGPASEPASEPAPVAEDAITPEEREMIRTVGAVRGAISATNQRNTYIFNISATTTDSLKSARISNALAALYIQDQIDVKFQATENAVSWLSERVVELEAELEEKQDLIKQRRSSMDISTLEALEVLNQQQRAMGDRLAEADIASAREEARLATLRDLAQNSSPAEIAAGLDDAPLERLAERIAAGAAGAEDLFADRLALLIEQAEDAVARQTQQSAALRASYDRLQERFDTQSSAVIELQNLERDLNATRTLYETFLTRLKETSVQRGLQQADSRVLSVATPGRYVEPRKSRIMALSMILGALLGAAIVLARQFLHQGYRTAETLSADTGLAVLGQIPKMPIRRRDQLIDYLNDKPTSPAVEAIRNLRTSVLLSNIDNPPQILLSASSLPGEGKTTQAISLAHNLAGLNKRVLLVEGDIRLRTLSEYFDIPDTRHGLIAAMTGEHDLSELLLRDSRMDVDILLGEKTAANAADVFSSERFRTFLEELRQHYDFIIIDTPPVLIVPDARIMSQFADAVVFSVAWDRTAKSQVTEAIRQFHSVNSRVTGLILSQIDPKGMRRYGYGGKYGAYSSYGAKYYNS